MGSQRVRHNLVTKQQQSWSVQSVRGRSEGSHYRDSKDFGSSVMTSEGCWEDCVEEDSEGWCGCFQGGVNWAMSHPGRSTRVGRELAKSTLFFFKGARQPGTACCGSRCQHLALLSWDCKHSLAGVGETRDLNTMHAATEASDHRQDQGQVRAPALT